MTLRILFTLAILAGMAAAPDAQTFTWQAGRSYDTAERAERIAEQVRRNVERSVRNAERISDQQLRNAERIEVQVRNNLNAQIRSQVRNEILWNRGHFYSYSPGFSRSAENAGAQ